MTPSIIPDYRSVPRKPSKGQSTATTEFLAYRSTIGRMVGRIVAPADVEDIVQESYIRVFEKCRDRELEYTKAYLYKTARNLALNFIARKGNYLVDSIEDSPTSLVNTREDQQEAELEAREKFRLFCRAVDKLPPQCRQALILKRVYGYSMKQIAEQMEISESTAEKHVAKGMVRCAAYLRDRGYPVGGNNK